MSPEPLKARYILLSSPLSSVFSSVFARFYSAFWSLEAQAISVRLNCPFVLHIGMFTLIDIPTSGLVRHIHGSIIPLSAQQALTSSTSFKQQDNTKSSPSTTITTHTRGPSTSCSRSRANRSLKIRQSRTKIPRRSTRILSI